MKFARPVICGLSIAVMASAIGLDAFSGAWFAFILAANTLATFAGTGERA
jgi:hypothetical protein